VEDNPSSPTEKVFLFSFRNTNIMVDQSPQQNADSSKSAGPTTVNHRNACDDEKTKEENDLLLKCLSNVFVTPSPVREGNTVFSAAPSWGTTITTAVFDTDPLMIKSVTLNFKNPAVGVAAAAGGGAAVGCAFGGPWGCAIGAGVGVLGYAAEQITTMTFVNGTAQFDYITPPYEHRWYDKVCVEDFLNENGEADSNVRREKLDSIESVSSLELPVVVEYRNNISRCWHPLPSAHAHGNLSERSRLTGWFYRFYPASEPYPSRHSVNKIPPVINPKIVFDSKTGKVLLEEFDDPTRRDVVYRTSYFEGIKTKDDSMKSYTFPVAACRAIEVQITTLRHLDDLESNQIKNNAARFPVLVADSNYLQPLHVPKNGIIQLLPVCGGFVSPTLSSPQSSEFIEAIVKQTQSVKDAQDKFKTSKQPLSN